MSSANPSEQATPMPEPAQDAAWPVVGVIMPILNEEWHFEEAVAAVLGQDCPGVIELVLALGPSHDRADEIAARIAAREPRVRTVQSSNRPDPRLAQCRWPPAAARLSSALTVTGCWIGTM